MAKYDIELVGKIGSMALIRDDKHDIDYNVFSRIGRDLVPGMIWVSSGAVEIGRLDYIKRTGMELEGDKSAVMTDYSSQGQAILMEEYRRFIPAHVRQLLVNIRTSTTSPRGTYPPFLLRCPGQAIIIVNYNDTVSLKRTGAGSSASCRTGSRKSWSIDTDETASVICSSRPFEAAAHTHVRGRDISRSADFSTLVERVEGKDPEEVVEAISELQKHCECLSWNGARKLSS